MAKKSESTSASSVSLPSASMATGAGGEVHQIAAQGQLRLTTNHGTPISDDHNSLKAGPRGPTLLEDFVLREKIFHFDHERIPERVVHARGLAAHGYFELTDSLSDLTTALVLGEAARVLKPGGRVLIVDMLPHEREEYRAGMGHLWLGFGEEQLTAWLDDAGFRDSRIVPLAPDPQAKGPSLFTARAVRTT